MKAGRELDALIAERVLRLYKIESGMWTDMTSREINGKSTLVAFPLPEYSTDIREALKLANKVGLGVHGQDGHYCCGSIVAVTAPLAICLAALKKVEER